MKLEPKKNISQESQSESIPLTYSQESQASNYKTSKKKSLTKQKNSTSLSTQHTDPSSSQNIQKKSIKFCKSKDLPKRINFDDIPEQILDLSKAHMDNYSQESSIPPLIRMIDTQSQNFGFCHSQLDDDNENRMSNIYQDNLEYEMEGRQVKYNNENSNNGMFPYTSYETVNIQQYHNNQFRADSMSLNQSDMQAQYGGIMRYPSRDMMAENTYAHNIQSSRFQTESNFSMNQLNRNVSQNNMMERSDEMQYNNENEQRKQQQPQQNSISNSNANRTERKLLGDITYQSNPVQSPQLEEEFQANNGTSRIDEEEQKNSSDCERTRVSKKMEEDNTQSNLFDPVDDMNFMEEMDFNGNHQYSQSMAFHPFDDLSNNNNQYPYINSQNSQQMSFQRPQTQSSNNLSMRDLLDSFKQDDIFGFDEQDLSELEARQMNYMVNPNALLSYESNFTNLPKKRAVLIDWMQEVSTGFQFKRETYQQSVSIVDRYFEKVPQIRKTQLQLVGATALLIAHKIEEVVCKKNEDFITICNGGYTNAQFNKMEIDICTQLKFELNPPTPYFWMNQLMLQWDGLGEQYKDLFEGEMIFFKQNDQRSFKLFSSVCQYIDCSFYNISIYSYPIKYVISLFMYWTLFLNLELNRDNDPKVRFLNQLFELFIQNTFNLSSPNELSNVRVFTEQFLDLQINEEVPMTHMYANRQSNYESYENVCSQQLYNRDFKRLFGIGE